MAAVALATLISGVVPGSADAFDIFGVHLFGAKSSDFDLRDPVTYEVTLTSDDDDLDAWIKKNSDLFSSDNKPVDGDFGLVVKARDDRERILAALYEKARYGAVVKISIEGTDIDEMPTDPGFSTNEDVPVEISVELGPQFAIGEVRFTDDAERLNPEDYDLKSGDMAGSKRILDAAEKLVDDLRKEGRPLAKLTQREVVADHASATVDITIGATSGPRAPVGDVTVTGAKTVDPRFVQEWSLLERGKPYTPEDMERAAKRLRELAVFSSVRIKQANKLDDQGAIPLTIDVAEGKKRYFGFGALVSSIDGLGVSSYWGHRNLFGKAESLKISGEIGRIGQVANFRQLDYSAKIAFIKPGAFGPLTTFKANLEAGQTYTSSYEARFIKADALGSFDITRKDTITGGLSVAWEDATDVYGRNRYLVTSLPLTWERDASDDKLNPTRGYRAMLKFEPSYDTFTKAFFTSAEGSVSAYKSIGEVVLAGRLSAGTLVGVASLSDITATRRFYAGGGGSVRGYGYQEISPRDNNNDALGGRSYVTGSIEARFQLNEQFGVVPFLDFGTVSSSAIPDFTDIRAGAGIGIRYATPLGPLRFDVALPLKRYSGGRTFGLYAGIGQAF